MPGKSRHGKGKSKRYQHQKIKSAPRPNATSTAPAVPTVAPEPSVPAATAPVFKTAAKPTGVPATLYAHVPSDLKRIGVLTAIMIVILVLLRLIAF